MIILDFYGVPGCGKSTLSNSVASYLRTQGFIVCEPSYEIDHKVTKATRRCLKIIYAILWIIKHPQKSHNIMRLICRHNLAPFNAISELINILYKAWYIEKYSFCDYIIFDEGITQAIISMDNSSSSSICEEIIYIEKIIGCSDNIIHIHLKEDIFVALKRMEYRESNDSRVEKEKDVVRKIKLMKFYQDLCNCVNLENSIIEYSPNCDRDSIAKMILNDIQNAKRTEKVLYER